MRKNVSRIPAYFQVRSRIYRHPILFVVTLMALLVAFGTGGYMFIEDWNFLDALYMTAITITTIGFGEVIPLSGPGRLFTIILIVTGVVIASYSLTTTIELITSDEFLRRIRSRRRRSALSKINHHCIICGFGRMGRSLVTELQVRGTEVIVIDTNQEVVETCRARGIPAVEGSAADERILHEAGIGRATALIAATPSDAENVFIILTARSINSTLKIISRCNVETSIPKLETAGADTVISPYSIAGQRIAHMLTHPNVANFIDGVLEFGDHQMRLEEFIVQKGSPLANLTLQEARLKAVVLAVDHPGEMVHAHPSADTKLLPGTAIIAMGLDEELLKLRRLVDGDS